MRAIFFLKMFKIKSKFTKCKRKIKKMLFASEIIASENVAKKCFYHKENTCYWQSMG